MHNGRYDELCITARNGRSIARLIVCSKAVIQALQWPQASCGFHDDQDVGARAVFIALGDSPPEHHQSMPAESVGIYLTPQLAINCLRRLFRSPTTVVPPACGLQPCAGGTLTQPSINTRALRLMIALRTVHWCSGSAARQRQDADTRRHAACGAVRRTGSRTGHQHAG